MKLSPRQIEQVIWTACVAVALYGGFYFGSLGCR